MPHEESPYPADWIRIAEKDLGRVDGLLEKHDPELAGFCLQQAVEKFLKRFFFFMDGDSDEFIIWMPFLMMRSLTTPHWRTFGVFVKRSVASTLWRGIHLL